MGAKRCLFVGLLTASIALGPGVSQAVGIKNVSPRFFDRADFQSISEFFGAGEQQGDRLILRTDSERRDGLYFVVDLDTPVSALPEGCRVVLDIVNVEAETVSLSFELGAQDRSLKRLLLGLTGDSWSTPGASALAWRVTLLGPEGEALTEAKSFLWEMP